MNNKKETKKYTFTVEGENEKWYLDWLKKEINKVSEYKVEIVSKVEQHPFKFSKNVNAFSVPSVVHICDYEGNEDKYIKKFNSILKELKDANGIKGKSLKYNFCYNNLSFELWILLHGEQSFNKSLTNVDHYLPYINKKFKMNFESMNQYKEKENFEKCLRKLSLNDVKMAIINSKKLMDDAEEKGYRKSKKYSFNYYIDNPTLTTGEYIEKILKECKIL